MQYLLTEEYSDPLIGVGKTLLTEGNGFSPDSSQFLYKDYHLT